MKISGQPDILQKNVPRAMCFAPRVVALVETDSEVFSLVETVSCSSQ